MPVLVWYCIYLVLGSTYVYTYLGGCRRPEKIKDTLFLKPLAPLPSECPREAWKNDHSIHSLSYYLTVR